MTKLINTRYVPENSTMIENEEIKLTVYLYTNHNGKPTAIAYTGKSSKPSFHYNFKDEERRMEYINEKINNRLEIKKTNDEWKERMKKENEALINEVKVGDIFYSSWGYEQTNVDFYQVIAKNKSMLTLKELNSELAEGTGIDQGYLKPLKDNFCNDTEIKKRLSRGRIKINSYQSATKLKAEKVWSSWYY
jgi:hypothetical protein